MVYMNDKFAESGENFADFQMTKPYFENGTMYRKVPKASWKNKDIKRLVLPPGTVVIEEQAFCGCMRLEAAELSNSLEEIAAGAFWGCMALRHISFPETLQVLGKFCFWGCCSLSEITVPDKVEKIPAWGFLGCSGLVRLCLPAKLKSIEPWAFSCCSSLMVVEIPKGTQEIGEGAFSKCSALRRISIPDTVLHIGKNALPDNAEGLTVVCSRNSAAYSYAQHYGLSCECPYEADKRVVARHKKHARPERENADWNYPEDTDSSDSLFLADNIEDSLSGHSDACVYDANAKAAGSGAADPMAGFGGRISDIRESSTIGELLASRGDFNGQSPKGNPLINVMIELSDSAKPNDQYDFKVYDSYEEAEKDILGEPEPAGDELDIEAEKSSKAGRDNLADNADIAAADDGVADDDVADAGAADGVTANDSAVEYKAADSGAAVIDAACNGAADLSAAASAAAGNGAVANAAVHSAEAVSSAEDISRKATLFQPKFSSAPRDAVTQDLGSPASSFQDSVSYEPEGESAYLGAVLSQAADTIGLDDSDSDDDQNQAELQETMADVWDGSMEGYENGKPPDIFSYYNEPVMSSRYEEYVEDNRRRLHSQDSLFGPSCLPNNEKKSEGKQLPQSRQFYNWQASRASLAASCIVPEKQLEALKARYDQEVRKAQKANGAHEVHETREDYDAQGSSIIPGANLAQEAGEAQETGGAHDAQESRAAQASGTLDSPPLEASSDETVLSHYLGEEKIVNIPSVINGKKVIALNDALFKGNNYIETVNIPDGVREIRKDAFRGCSALRNVNIPDTVVSIGEGAFRGCERLKKVILPGGLTEIGEKAFSGCSRLEAVAIPDDVCVIPRNAFAGSALRMVVCSDDSYAAAWADANMIIHAKEFLDNIAEVADPQFAERPAPEDIAEDDPEEANRREKAKSKYLKRMSNAGKNKKWKKNF